MGIFGIGAMEAFVILIIALLIFGPGRLPEIMGEAGRTLRDFRRATRDLTGDFQDSIQEVRMTAQEVQSEMRQTADELEDDMRQTATDIESSTQVVADSVNDSVPANLRKQRSAKSTGSNPANMPPTLESEARAAEAKGRGAQAPAHESVEDSTATTGTQSTPTPSTATRASASVSKPSKEDPLADLAGLDEDLTSPNGSSEMTGGATNNGRSG